MSRARANQRAANGFRRACRRVGSPARQWRKRLQSQAPPHRARAGKRSGSACRLGDVLGSHHDRRVAAVADMPAPHTDSVLGPRPRVLADLDQRADRCLLDRSQRGIVLELGELTRERCAMACAKVLAQAEQVVPGGVCQLNLDHRHGLSEEAPLCGHVRRCRAASRSATEQVFRVQVPRDFYESVAVAVVTRGALAQKQERVE